MARGDSGSATGPGFVGTAIAVLAFGAAFGYMEATVVAYLRAALGLVPGAVMAHDPGIFGTFEAVEIARELATLVMIATVGWIAGRTGLERLAWAAVVFGAWDIVYYIGLRLVIAWPPSLDTWDVLFLVPMPWVGPVWAPIVVSLALIVVGLAAARLLRAKQRLRVGPARAFGAVAGGILVIVSFLVDTSRLAASDPGPWTGWPLFWGGMALAAVATVTAMRDEGPAAPRSLARPYESEGRPQVGTPD